MKRTYNIIVPRLDSTGPTNVAIDLATVALTKGYDVKLFYLSGRISRADLGSFSTITKFRIYNFLSISGVIHTHGLRPDLLGGLLSFRKNCVTISTLHGQYPHHIASDYSNWKLFLGWLAWRIALKKFDFVVCISRTMQRYYRRYLPKIITTVIYNSRSISNDHSEYINKPFNVWLRKNRMHSRYIVLYVGSITTRKDILNFLMKFESLDEVCFVVCGDGPLKSEMLNLESFTNGKNYYLGHISHPEMIMKLCDALVLPSKAEGFPLVVLECYFSGRPALLSNIAVHRELHNLGLGHIFNKHIPDNFIKNLTSAVNSTSSIGHSWSHSKRFIPDHGFSEYEKIFSSIKGK